jgi:hypothetical protein
MNLQQIYDYVEALAVKENSGGTFTPLIFNNQLPVVVREAFGIFRKQYEQTRIISEILSNYEVVLGDELIPHLAVSKYGKAVIPPDLEYMSSITYPYTTSSERGDPEIEYRPIDELTDDEFAVRESSASLPPTLYDPIMTIRQGYYDFRPKNIMRVKLVYLKKPEIPVYDYYIDANLRLVYLPPNTSHLLGKDETGSAGQVAPATVVSQTVELIMHESTHPLICYMLLMKLGITIKDMPVIQFAELLMKM